MNVDILGISELKWTGMDEFNSDDHYIYYCAIPGDSRSQWKSPGGLTLGDRNTSLFRKSLSPLPSALQLPRTQVRWTEGVSGPPGSEAAPAGALSLGRSQAPPMSRRAELLTHPG